MQIFILTAGEKTLSWIESGVNQYIARMPGECKIKILTLATGRRAKNQTIKQIQMREQELLIRNTPKNSLRIALDERGEQWSTGRLAIKLRHWLQSSPVVTFYIGGPDGLTEEFLDQADAVWSVSALTLPHMLVRVLLVEQLYRAWTIIQGHPYHRA